MQRGNGARRSDGVTPSGCTYGRRSDRLKCVGVGPIKSNVAMAACFATQQCHENSNALCVEPAGRRRCPAGLACGGGPRASAPAHWPPRASRAASAATRRAKGGGGGGGPGRRRESVGARSLFVFRAAGGRARRGDRRAARASDTRRADAKMASGAERGEPVAPSRRAAQAGGMQLRSPLKAIAGAPPRPSKGGRARAVTVLAAAATGVLVGAAAVACLAAPRRLSAKATRGARRTTGGWLLATVPRRSLPWMDRHRGRHCDRQTTAGRRPSGARSSSPMGT